MGGGGWFGGCFEGLERREHWLMMIGTIEVLIGECMGMKRWWGCGMVGCESNVTCGCLCFFRICVRRLLDMMVGGVEDCKQKCLHKIYEQR